MDGFAYNSQEVSNSLYRGAVIKENKKIILFRFSIRISLKVVRYILLAIQTISCLTWEHSKMYVLPAYLFTKKK